ncbi:MAG: hypothetical protein JO171_01190 [Paludibacterium sp.]|uniref:COG4648 family protein n=1 Tax=Paludibacterium sp. TaxID=1917523 RepID=UPI0025E37E3D|nr:hypothetical protein [Paludibacterium sp.]MBV8045740.1 hypothetical protein [Paludibacterium sp.]MBV8649755.1 hypothetical protein [Paludibacterium sp.]
MTPLRRALAFALLAGVLGLYVLLSYVASSSTHPPVVAVVVGSLPLAAGIVAACWRSPFRWAATAACLAALAAIALNIDRLLGHAAWLYFVQHLGAMVSLGVLFGSTLKSHEGALCSRVARIAIAEPLDARYRHYTWRVTLAWTSYFAISALVSITLFCWAPLPVWAFFATVLTPVSLGVMFGGEFLIRLRVMPDRPHFNIAQTIRSYRQYMQQRKTTGTWGAPTEPTE